MDLETARIKINAALAKYRSFQRLIENLVYIAGVWPHHEDTVSFYRFTTIVGIFLSGTMGTKVLVYALANLSNVMKLVLALRSVVAAYAATTRMTNGLVYRKELVFLDEELGAKFEEKLQNERNHPALLKKISIYSKFMHFLNISTGTAILMYLAPFFILNFKHKKNIPILPGKYPFPVEPGGLLYWTIFASEGIMFGFMFFAVTGVDNAFGMHCFRICGLLRLATERFNDLNPYDSNCKTLLYECISMHQLAIQSKLALQRAYGAVIMWIYITCAIVLCTLLWQIDQVKSQISLLKLINVLFYMAVNFVQCFIYAYYGACITLESENYKDAVYTCRWPDSENVRLVKDLLLILTQRTISLKACGYFLITMEFFEKICNTTVSYFFLLQSMDAKH